MRERAAAAKEERIRRAENREINRERDPEARKKLEADVERRRAERAQPEPKADEPKVGGPLLDPDGKPVDANGQPLPDGGGGGPNAPGGGGPNAPGGGGGEGPKEPKKPEQLIVDKLGTKLDDIKTELEKIEKHLQC